MPCARDPELPAARVYPGVMVEIHLEQTIAAPVEKLTPGTPLAPNTAVPVGTAVFGNQLLAALKLLVRPFHVAFCAQADGASPLPQSSKITQRAELRVFMTLPRSHDATS